MKEERKRRYESHTDGETEGMVGEEGEAERGWHARRINERGMMTPERNNHKDDDEDEEEEDEEEELNESVGRVEKKERSWSSVRAMTGSR